MKLLIKQEHAVFYLKDSVTSELVYGGAAGGGKSALGCLWLIENCQKYKGSRWVMGRSKLKALKETTLNTFFEITSKLGIGNQFKFNAQSNVITWNNGSEILLKDLFLYPSDPEFDSLGSLEITGAFVDECNQITVKAWQVLKSRCRYKLKEFGLIGKVFGTCNPSKNWVYGNFYKPFKVGELPSYRKFIQALPKDNPHLPESYLESLSQMDKNSRERLLFGNWEYDDDPDALCGIDEIHAIFENDHVQGSKKYLTADIARMGSDKAVLFVWDGWKVIEKITFDISKTTDIQRAINALRTKHQISKNNCVGDGDGVGGGVIDNTGIIEFKNGSKALNNENYFNLQTQCVYFLADKINKHEIYLECDFGEKEKEEIIEELEYLKSYNSDQEGKIRALPKEMIKENIGRSPDWRDALMMRAYFDLKPKNSAPVSSSSFKK
jgi:phage terminase large subunit